MADHPNVEVVRGALEAFGRGDVDGRVGSMSDGVVFHAPGTGRFSGRFEGKDAVRDRFERMREAGIEMSVDVHDVVGNDEHVVALVHVHARNAAGQRYDQEQVQVSHMRDGLVEEFWIMNQDQAVLDLLLG
ncbi:MAG: nuclear transport factor 2 family protein [Actinomycetota bacterium]